jgi:hypothetical protein
MRRRWIRPFLITQVLIQVATYAAAQQEGATDFSDVWIYVQFFRRIASYNQLPGHYTSHGKAYRIVIPNAQKTIGLSDYEMTSLTEVAAACDSEVLALSGTHEAIVFESLLETLESGKTSKATADQVDKLRRRIPDLLLAHMRDLRLRYGMARFGLLDAYVRSLKWKTELAPHVEPDDQSQK